MDKCACGSGLGYELCCKPVISGAAEAKTAEALLRARYTAHVLHDVDFIVKSIHPDKAGDHDPEIIKEWANTTRWCGLEVIEVIKGGESDQAGTVEFRALFEKSKGQGEHAEVAQFVKKDGRWYFLDAAPPKVRQVINEKAKPGRNDPCICGSGKKYKKCCG